MDDFCVRVSDSSAFRDLVMIVTAKLYYFTACSRAIKTLNAVADLRKIMETLFGNAQLLKGCLPKTGVVGLYFSAHWCPPCREFTPRLAEAYKEIKKNPEKPFEILFISSDQDQTQFESYFSEMPWLALPFENRDTKEFLSKKFKVKGIPTLVLLEAPSGKLINNSGRSALSKDPTGLNYPWTPPRPLEALGTSFIGADKDAIKGKYVGVYFSAHWCEPCRNFTPKLVETYKKVKSMGKGFEVVFSSADRDREQFDEYFTSMPWLAVPYEDRDRANTLSEVPKMQL